MGVRRRAILYGFLATAKQNVWWAWLGEVEALQLPSRIHCVRAVRCARGVLSVGTDRSRLYHAIPRVRVRESSVAQSRCTYRSLLSAASECRRFSKGGRKGAAVSRSCNGYVSHTCALLSSHEYDSTARTMCI